MHRGPHDEENVASTSAISAISPTLAALSITASFATMLGSGAEFAYSQYSDDLKQRLGIDQEAEEVIASVLMFWSCMGPLNGLLINQVPQRINCFISTFCLSVGYFIAFLAVRYESCRYDRVVPTAFCFIGFGTGLSFAVGLDNMVHSVRPHLRGRLVSLLSATSPIVCVMYALAYSEWLDNDPYKPSDLLLGLSIIMAISGLFTCIFMRRVLSNREDQPCTLRSNGFFSVVKSSAQMSFFWIVAIVLFVQSGLGSMHLLNLGGLIKSVSDNPTSDTKSAVIISGLSACFGRAMMSFSDWIPIRRGYFGVLTMGISLLSALGILFYSNSMWMVYISTIGFGISYGSTWALYPIIVSESFPVEDFSSTWGVLSIMPGLGSTCFNFLAGMFYDAHLSVDNECTGSICYHETYVFGTYASALGLLVLFFMVPSTKVGTDSLLEECYTAIDDDYDDDDATSWTPMTSEQGDDD